MNCKAAQTDLLSLEHPDQPPPDLAAHLAQCTGCREYMFQLVQLERHVPLLPVPASSAKSRAIARILTSSPPVSVPRAAPAPAEPGWVKHERRLKRLAVASALTAALVLIAVGLGIWRFSHDSTPVNTRPAASEDPLLANLMTNNLRLASAKTPQQRLEALADVADDLQSETRSLAQVADAGDLATLARMYQKVVREGIVPQAKALPAAERVAVLTRIANRLGEVDREASSLADQMPDGRAAPLRDIAAAARDGNLRLVALMRGEKS